MRSTTPADIIGICRPDRGGGGGRGPVDSRMYRLWWRRSRHIQSPRRPRIGVPSPGLRAALWQPSGSREPGVHAPDVGGSIYSSEIDKAKPDPIPLSSLLTGDGALDVVVGWSLAGRLGISEKNAV